MLVRVLSILSIQYLEVPSEEPFLCQPLTFFIDLGVRGVSRSLVRRCGLIQGIPQTFVGDYREIKFSSNEEAAVMRSHAWPEGQDTAPFVKDSEHGAKKTGRD